MFVVSIHYPVTNAVISYAFKDGWAAFYEVCQSIQYSYKVSVIHSETLEKANW